MVPDHARALREVGVEEVPSGWSLETVGQACSILNNLRLPLSVDERKTMKGDFPYYGPTGCLDHINEFRVEGRFALIGEDGDHFIDYNGKPQTQLVSGRFNVNNHAHIVGDGSRCSVDWFYISFFRRRLIPHLTRQGAGRYKLNKGALEKVPILVPPLPEQRKIAEILSTWDRAIDTTEALLANARTQKRALMQSLLTGKRRFPEFEGQEWRELPFGQVFVTTNDKKTQINKRDYQTVGPIPVIDQGKEFIVGYTDSTTVYEDIPVIVFGDHTRELKWVDFPFCPGADGTQLLKTKPGTDIQFGYYLLQNTELPNLGYSRHMRELKQRVFSVPQNEAEQLSISAVLEDAERKIRLLRDSMKGLQAEKKALMQQLLTGKRRVVV